MDKLISSRCSAKMNKLIIVIFGWFALSIVSIVHANDYVLDPNPRNYSGKADLEGKPFESAKDPKACTLFLKNLRYFARKNMPMSCGQPIAPLLASKITPAEWEDIDPEKYPDLFKSLVTEVFPPRLLEDKTYPTEEDLSSWRKSVRDGSIVFRRARLALKAHLLLPSREPTKEALSFQIVQFGSNVTDPANPNSAWRCEQSLGRAMPPSNGYLLRFFVVSENLSESYNELTDLQLGYSGFSYSDLWLINGQLYGELYDDKGNVLLSEIRLDPAVQFERVCLFHYKK